jgi:hypothetical protein
MLIVIVLNVVMLNVAMLSVILLNYLMLCFVMLSVFMLSVIILNVVATTEGEGSSVQLASSVDYPVLHIIKNYFLYIKQLN